MSANPPVIHGNAIDRIKREARVPVMFVFAARWSEACRRQIADAVVVARQVTGHAEVYIVDIDASRQVASGLNIHSIPTVIVFDGGTESVRFIGLQPIATLMAALAGKPRAHPPSQGSSLALSKRFTA